MTGTGTSIKLTVAQAIVRHLMNQYTEINGVKTRICFGVFGHGNVPVVETIAGRANTQATRPLNIGPLGMTGSGNANTLAGAADVAQISAAPDVNARHAEVEAGRARQRQGV